MGEEDDLEVTPFNNLFKTFMVQVVLKAEKYQDQDIPKKQIVQIIESLEQEKVKIAILDVLQVTLDPGLGKLKMTQKAEILFHFSDPENHPESTIFMMEYLTDDCKNDESFINVANLFETWITGRTNQNTEQLEKEEFTAGWIMKRSESMLNEDSRRRSFDRIRQMKLYELGQEKGLKYSAIYRSKTN